MSKKELSPIDTVAYTPTVPKCLTHENCYACPVKACAYAVQTLEAVRLIQTGARTSLIAQLTTLPKSHVRNLHLRLCGQASPRGMAPFTDAWFRESEQRMLHASAVWRISKLIEPLGRSKARTLLDIHDLYLSFVNKPLLDITRIDTVLKLVKTAVWQSERCQYCCKYYLTPADEDLGNSCPGCRIYHRFRCSQCSTALTVHTLGRRRSVCERCAVQDNQ